MSVAEDSPSAERRKALKEADASNQLRVLGSCPLTKYIDIADRLMEHFQDAVDGRRLDEAYIFGLRFANLCISSLPQHPEYGTSSRARKRLTSQVGDVLSMMDVIKQRMDAEELMKIKAELLAKEEEEARKKEEEDRQKLKLDEERQREQKIRNALEEERAQFLAEQRAIREEEIKKKLKAAKAKEEAAKAKEEAAKKLDIEKSAMAKLEAMQAQMSSAVEQAPQKVDVTETKKKTKLSNVVKVKTIGWTKKKSNPEPKEEKEPLPPQRPNKQSEFIDLKSDTPAPPMTLTNTVETSTLSNISAITEDVRKSPKIERKTSKGEKKKPKRTIATSTKSPETEIEPETAETKEEAKSVPEESIAMNSKMSDSDSSRSITSKKSKLKSKIKSTIEAAKSSIPTMPSPMLKLSTKKSASNIIGNQSTKISVNSTAKSTTDSIIAAKLHTPRSQKEKASIEKLKRVISVQEDRLEEIEGKQIPDLLEAAKSCLKEDKKKEALKCLAHKKRLERMVETIKAAVFNMETQMFMLESAMEDRHVKKALDEAASAMAGLQQNIGDPNTAVVDLKNMSASLPELEIGDATDEELMEELEQWLSPEEKGTSQENKIDENISLLSMPTFLPTAPEATPTTPSVLDRIPTKL